MDFSDTKANLSKEDLIKRLLEKVESLNNEGIIKMLLAAEDISTAENSKMANEAKREPQPSTSYASNENINEELLIPNTQQKHKKIAGKPNDGQRTSMFQDTKMYNVDIGTINSGREYEFKMLPLLCIRCILKKPAYMWIATNVKDVGKFDDIICYFKTKGGPGVTYMVQMKHEEAQSEIRKKDFTDKPFNLRKHTKGFFELEKMLVNSTRSDDAIENLDPNKIISVFFTNRIASNFGIPYFEECTNEDLMLLNTNVENKHLYKFDVTSGRALGLTNHEYCENIYFLSNQVNETDMDICIFEEVVKLIKELSLTRTNAHNVAKDFVEYITKRAKCKLQKRQYLMQDQVLYKLADLLLSEYTAKFNNELDTSHDCPNKAIWKKIVNDKKITYVSFDEVTFNYLKEYISSEVKSNHDKYNNLSNENRESFLHEDSNFEVILGKQGILTALDIYKCMWVNNKIPLLLEINNEEEHQNVLSILNWSKLDLKIMIVNKAKLTLPTWLNTVASFVNLNDLNEGHQRLILGQSVSLQGRKGRKLGDFVSASMYKCIKCNDIIHILTGNYNIGNNYPSVEYFIERSVYKVLIKFEALEKIKDEAFIIHDQAPKGLLMNKLEDLNVNYSTFNLIIVQDTIKEDVKELKSKYKSIHRLIFHEENWLEWVESQGQTERIKQYLVQINNLHSTILDTVHDYVLKDNVLNKTHIVSGCPGMAKTTLIDFISNKAPSNMWVLKITLNDHSERFKTVHFMNASDHIKYFNGKIINDGSCLNIPLAEAVFHKLLTDNKILVFLDGFDEVSVSHKDETTNMMKSLHKSGIYMWISTRPHMNSHLEEEFGTIALTIMPFTLQDQKIFFIKYFAECIQNSPKYKALIDKFIEKLLNAAEKNLNDSDREFMEIPLQCKLLADFFTDDLKTSLSQNLISAIEDFNLLQLYEDFINKKRNKYDKSVNEMYKIFFDYHQKLLALNIIFPKEYIYELNIDQELSDYYRNNKNRMELLQREGILVVHENKQTFSATFVHRTFAEFIAAQWLAENYNSTNSKIKNTAEFLLNKRFSDFCHLRFLFRIFDSLFVKEFPLHSAIINKQIPQIKKMLSSSPEDINKLDKCKRSVLHLIALYSNTKCDFTGYKIVNRNSSIILDQMLDIIEVIPIGQVIDLCGRDSFGYNPLDYAILCGSLPIIDTLREKSNEIIVTIDITKLKGVSYIDNYKLELSRRFQYCVWKCIEMDLDDNLSLLRDDIIYEDFDYLNNLNLKTITDVIEKFKIKSTSENYYSDLRFAAAFGTIDNVKQLLAEGADVNQRIFGYTPLYCAVQKHRPKIVEILLSEMAKVNATCFEGNTALHAASEAGYKNVAEMLIKSGADINKKNEFGETPLIFASERYNINIVNLLLQHEADVNKMSVGGYTCLHVAAEMGSQNLIRKFIQCGADVNIINVNGRTPLFLALENGQIDVVNLLIKEDIKVDIIDDLGNSYLHAAAAAGQSDVLLYFIERGLDVNKKNDEGETPLRCAQKCGNLNIAKLLYKNGANTNDMEYQRYCVGMEVIGGNILALYEYLQSGFDVNVKDEHNNTLIFTAIKYGNIAAANLLIDNKAEIDIFEKNNEYSPTLLSLVIEKGYTHILKLLLENNTKLDYIDMYAGNTCLHVAAKAGEIGIISLLIGKGHDINKQNKNGETPLLCALKDGHNNAAKFLLANKAKVDIFDNSCNSCLHFAAELGEIDIVQHIINEDFNVNFKNNQGETPLLFAFPSGDVSVIELLLKSNAKINKMTTSYVRCLHAAAFIDQSHVVSQLINAGLDVNRQNLSGQTYLLIALKCGCLDAAKTLILCGADFNLRDIHNRCHLYYATKGSCLEDWIQFLHVNNYRHINDSECDFTVKNPRKQTLLHVSVDEISPKSITKLQHHKRTVNFLLSGGINVNKKDQRKRTVLHYICGYWALFEDTLTHDFYENMATLILNTNININAKDEYGKTGLDLAIERRHYKIASIIRHRLDNVEY